MSDSESLSTRDWLDWHRDYESPSSPLSRRLDVVRRHLSTAISSRAGRRVEVVSLCAGQGDDIFGVLSENNAVSTDIHVRLIELDERNAEVARRRAPTHPLVDVEVVEADAGELATYHGQPRGDVVLVCGVFGNITHGAIFHTIDVLAQLCNRGATVIWTRSRRTRDITPRIRQRFVDRRFTEIAFVAPDDDLWSVGVNVFDGEPQPLEAGERMFEFVI